MTKIVLQFSTCATSWQSTVIRKLCHSPFSHVDFVLPDGNLLGSSGSPEIPVVEGNPNGVAVRPPNYQEFGIRRNAVIETNKGDEIERILRTQLGKPFDDEALYDFFGDFQLPRDWRQPDRWFCSELFTWAFEKGGLFSYDLLVPKNRVSPPDLLLLLNPYINTKTFWNPIAGLKLGAQER